MSPDFRDLLSAFNAHGVEYLVVGAYALAAHGPSRVLSYYENTEAVMPMSIRLDPALEARIDLEARRLGLTKSAFVKDALQRVLGLKSPARLLRAVRRAPPMGDPGASQNVSAKVKAKLRAKRAA